MNNIFTASRRFLSALPPELRDEAGERYQKHAPLLFERLSRLYGEQDDFPEWFASLLESVGRQYAARSPALRALDSQRIGKPGWFLKQQMLGYCAYVDRFGGDLNGVAQRIPYLRELQVRYLHLLPFLRARAGENDGGFAVASYDEVEPRLGSIADLERLASALREADISLCADFVLNHVADDHAWAQAAAQGDARLQGYFHTFAERSIPDDYEQTVAQIFPEAAPGNFTYAPAMQCWVWTTFYPYQWDLNYANPAVFAEMVNALLGLANRGVDVFRLDSAAFLWKRQGTNCMNQPEAHWILQAIRCVVDIVAPGVLLKAEAIVPSRELPAYFGEGEALGRECHLAYHSSLMAAAWVAIAEQDTTLLRKVVQETPDLPADSSWLTYVRCHDDIGWKVLSAEVAGAQTSGLERLAAVSRFFEGATPGSFARGSAFQTAGGDGVHGSNGMASALLGYASAEDEVALLYAERRLVLLYGLAFCFGGLPLIYMGDELALGNDETPQSAAARALDGRWLQRPLFDDARLAERKDSASRTGRTFGLLSKLIRLRCSQSGLAADQPRHVSQQVGNAVLAVQRGDHFLGLMNFSAGTVTVAIADAVANAYSGSKTGAWQDRLTNLVHERDISLPPWTMAWLENQNAFKGG